MNKKVKTLLACIMLVTTILFSPIKASAYEETKTIGWSTVDGITMYFDGVRYVTGWQYLNNKWYYFSDTGCMLKSTCAPGGYYVGTDGAWIPNVVLTPDTNPLWIVDSNLELEIRNRIGKPTGTLYRNDVCGVTSFVIRNANIKTLEGLEYFVNLKEFSITDKANVLTDITAIRNMPSLKGVCLRSFNLTPTNIIQTLEGMKLSHISLYGNNFTEIDKQRLTNAVPTAFTDYL